MRKLLIAALALSAFVSLAPSRVDARRILVTKEVRWLNVNRVGGATPNATAYDTAFTSISASGSDTTANISINDWAPCPYEFKTNPYQTVASSGTFGDTVLVGRLFVYIDSSGTSTVTAALVAFDVMGPDYRSPDVTAPTGVSIQSMAFTSMGSRPFFSFPIFAVKNNTSLTTLATDPTALGGLLGATGIRCRIGTVTGSMGARVRAYVSYWVESS